ncbi:hypothetical protein HELRODRAFT_168365 [Helobdella robusta]|uniref:Uncharacterized protein n=1 Tax=Helobdella robusta TaxID=6412 RepID=T1F0H4_HELRO|nr:hypothetical protein HELRODRAFT_168365 [Helobdella robusta]ESO09384.1 hypothetical protein HELRODRAFT_168365 [Helobdella robusta]
MQNSTSIKPGKNTNINKISHINTSNIDISDEISNGGFILNGTNGDNEPTPSNLRLSLISTWEAFRDVTTSHGLPHFSRAKGDKFMKYSVSVAVELNHAKSMEFPAVTICNNNPMKLSSFRANSKLQEILISYKLKNSNSTCTMTETSTPAPLTTTRETSSQYTTKTQICTEYDDEVGGIQQRRDFKLFNQVMELFMRMNATERKESAPRDFKYFFNNYYGNCYTFNSVSSGQDGAISKISRKTGPSYGLSITFNVEQNDYVGEVAQSAGLRVVVHDPKRMPFPEDESIFVSPWTVTQIGLTMTQTKKINGLYGNCSVENDSSVGKTLYQKLFNVSYCEKVVMFDSYVYYRNILNNLRSMGQVLVYFQDFSYTNIEESPDYETIQFTSDIGGILGLYVGFSILTVVEFLELAVDVLGIIGYQIYLKSQNSVKKWRKENGRKIGHDDKTSKITTSHSSVNTVFACSEEEVDHTVKPHIEAVCSKPEAPVLLNMTPVFI